MSLVLRSYRPPSEDCGICREPLHNGEAVVEHWNSRKNNRIHPFHETCLRIWTRTISECPLCKAPLILDSLNNDHLLPWKERSTKALKQSIRIYPDERYLALALVIWHIFLHIFYSYAFAAAPLLTLEHLMVATIVIGSFLTGALMGARMRGKIGSIVGVSLGSLLGGIALPHFFKEKDLFPGTICAIMGIFLLAKFDLEHFLIQRDLWQRQQRNS